MAEQEIITKLAAIERNTLLAAKNVLDIDDVALLTGLSKSHIYYLTCNSQIPHYKPTGKHLYFDRAEVESWMKRNRVNTQEEAEQAAIKYVVAGSVKVSGRVKGGRP
jgi:excisionase family DNA binding protein